MDKRGLRSWSNNLPGLMPGIALGIAQSWLLALVPDELNVFFWLVTGLIIVLYFIASFYTSKQQGKEAATRAGCTGFSLALIATVVTRILVTHLPPKPYQYTYSFPLNISLALAEVFLGIISVLGLIAVLIGSSVGGNNHIPGASDINDIERFPNEN